MTIGPAPMMSTLLMSVRLGTLALVHQSCEAIEEITDVVRPRARFGMPLETERRPVGARETLQAAVEQRYVRRFQIRRKRVRIDGEAVVLAGDDDRSARQILHRVVGTVMPEFHFHGLRARGETHELVAEADAERRRPGVDDFADRTDRVVAGLRVPRAVGQKHSGRLEREDFLRARLRGKNRDATAALDQHAQYVALDAVVVSDDVEAPAGAFANPAAGLPPPLGPFVALGGRHDLGQIHSREPWERPGCRHRPIPVAATREQGAILGAFFAHDPSEAKKAPRMAPTR